MPVRDKTSPDNVYAETLPEGVMLLVRHFQSFELILLDNNFQVQKSAFLENAEDRRDYLGMRETADQYIIYFDRDAVRDYVEIVSIDKGTFEPKSRPFYPDVDGYFPIQSFVLENDFFSVSMSRKQKKLRILRSFGEEETHVFTFDMDKRALRQINRLSVPIMAVKDESAGTSRPITERGQTPNILQVSRRQHFYLDDQDQLMLTNDRQGMYRSDLLIYRFKMEPDKPGASEFTTQLLSRVNAEDIWKNPTSYIYDNHLYSLVIGREQVLLEVYELNTLKRVASLNSMATDPTKSIKPDALFQERMHAFFGRDDDVITGERRVKRWLTRGLPGLIVAEKADHLELTIGTYIFDEGGETRVVNSTQRYYRVKLDKTNFNSLGKSDSFERTDDQTMFFARNRLDESSYRRSYTLFRKDGVDYFGYQSRGENSYTIMPFTLN